MGKEISDILPGIRRFINRNTLFDKQAKIIAAVSGGIDSMTMLDVLLALRHEFELTLAVAHVNYGLRGVESDRDEQVVRDYAGNKKLRVFAVQVDPDDPALKAPGSFQERARNIRYTFFERIRVKLGFDYIATGHNADDNAETVFLNLLRGSGPDGLRGIPPKRDTIIRPLIECTRKDIELYAHANGIPHRVDASNITGRYARNVVRNEVFPLIQTKLRENVRDSINRTSEIIRSVDDYLHDEVKRQGAGIVQQTGEHEFFLETGHLQALHPVIIHYIVRETAGRLTGSPVSFEITKRVVSLLIAPAGTSVIINPGYRVDKESSGIRFLGNKDPEEFFVSIELNEEYRFEEFTFRSSFVTADRVSYDTDKMSEYVDADKLHKPFILRRWNEGDRMRPLGMKSFKKVSDIFTDAKVPGAYKHRIPLIESRDGIVWICGVQLDDRFKITDNTQHIVKMEYIPHATRPYRYKR